MPRASRIPVNKNVEGEIKDNFSTLISSLSNSSEISEFFNDFLTREEQIMLSKRLMLHLMLERGYKGSHIQSVLNINKDTIRIHSAVWQRGGNVYRQVLSKIAKKAEVKEIWKKIDEALESILKPAGLFIKSRNDMKARAKFASGDWE